MMRKSFLLLTAMLASLCPPGAAAQDARESAVAIPSRSAGIEIDGVLDDWADVAPLELRSGGLVRGGEWRGPSDLSALVWLAWDEQRLYFAADVRDVDYRGAEAGRRIWDSDAFVVIIGFPGEEAGGNLYYLMFSTTDGEATAEALVSRRGGFSRKGTNGLTCAAKLRDGLAPVFEGSIAWTDLLGPGAAAPDRIEFNIEVRDRDGESLKSMYWLPSTTGAPGRVDLCAGLLLRPGEMGGMLGDPRPAAAFSTNVQLVELPLTVTDGRNEYVRDLDENDFIVLEDGEEQQIRSLLYETRPVTVGLLMDSSGSMLSYLAQAKRASLAFLDALREEDRAFVVSFNNNVELLKDFDGDVEEAKEAIGEIRARGGTVLHTALYYSLEKLQYLREKKVLVVFSDGKDESVGAQRLYPFDIDIPLLRETAQRHEVLLYAVAFQRYRTDALTELESLAKDTGGRLFTPHDVDDILTAYLDIARELKSQYLISYVSSNPNLDGLWRNIEVKVRDRDYQVRTRAGYFAPKQ